MFEISRLWLIPNQLEILYANYDEVELACSASFRIYFFEPEA